MMVRVTSEREEEAGAPAVRCEFGPMTLADIVPVVMPIERRAHAFPWTEGIFRDCVRAGYTCLMMGCGSDVVGYGIMSVAAQEAHLLNLCIAPEWQGRGYGRRLLTCLISRARAARATCMLLEVRVSNKVAQSLYESSGFFEIGRRGDYYPARVGREDALVLARMFD